MGTEYKPVQNTRSNGTVKEIYIKQFAGGEEFDGLALQLTTNTEKSQKGGDLDFFQALQISKQDIPELIRALGQYHAGVYPTHLEYVTEQSHFNSTCNCKCTERDEIEM